MVRRPGVVTFIGVILLIQAFLNLVVGIVLLAFKDRIHDFLAENGATVSDATITTSWIGALIGALLLFLVGSGILRGSRGWRAFVVIVEAINMALAIYLMITHPHGSFFVQGGIALAIGVFVIWALYGHDASDEYFSST